MPLIVRLFFLSFFLLNVPVRGSGQSGRSPSPVSIKAFLPAWEKALVTLRINGSTLTAGTVKNGIFSYNFFSDTVAEGTLEIRSRSKATYSTFFLEAGTIRILDEGTRIQAYGTELNDRFAALERSWDSSARAESKFTALEANNWKRKQVAQLIENEPGSPLSLRMLYRYFYLDPAADDTLYFRLFHLLGPRLKYTTQGKKMEEEVTGRHAVALGRKAAFLSLPDLQKNVQAIYDTGSYTLVHFWASWCQPCRRENILLRDVYKEFGEQKLVMKGVSMDQNYSAWKQAISWERLTWTQLSDLKGWDSPVAKAYNIVAIPFNILIGPDGTILGKNLGPADIRKFFSKEHPNE